jgi:hypothetical protein
MFLPSLVLVMVNSYNEDTRLQALYQSSSYKAHHTMGTQDKTKQAWIASLIQTKGTSKRTPDLHYGMNMVTSPYFQPIVDPKPWSFLLHTWTWT